MYHKEDNLSLELGLGDGCNFKIVGLGFFWIYYDACMYGNVASAITLVVIKIEERCMP